MLPPALAAVARRQHGLLTRRQCAEAGMSPGQLRHLVASARWRRVLPHTFATFTGQLDDGQRRSAALLYAGPGARLGRESALQLYGVRYLPRSESVSVVVPFPRAVRPVGFVRVQTSRRNLQGQTVGGFPCAPLPMAVADIVRLTGDVSVARAIVADVVQRLGVAPSLLAGELSVPRPAPLLRYVLAEITAGVRSSAEGRLRDLLLASDLPAAEFNGPILREGVLVACGDVVFRAFCVIVEVESAEWHLSPRDWQRTMTRHNLLAGMGYQVLHIAPSRLMHEPEAVLAEIRAVLVRAGFAG